MLLYVVKVHMICQFERYDSWVLQCFEMLEFLKSYLSRFCENVIFR